CGNKEFCENRNQDMINGLDAILKIRQRCSMDQLSTAAFDSNNLIIVSQPDTPYEWLSKPIQDQISQDDYKRIGKNGYRIITIGKATVLIRNIR
ncbi:MAG: hypothetical protein ACM3PP_04625, partial [Candidatus Saccharibacteria bacterium]